MQKLEDEFQPNLEMMMGNGMKKQTNIRLNLNADPGIFKMTVGLW